MYEAISSKKYILTLISQTHSDVYLEPNRLSKMELFQEKASNVDIRLDSRYASGPVAFKYLR